MHKFPSLKDSIAIVNIADYVEKIEIGLGEKDNSGFKWMATVEEL